MKKIVMKVAAVAALLLAPAIAEAAEGYATANVNMRAGPSTQYPAVTVIPAGESVEIHGCLADVPWCDVEFYGGRGWVAGAYVQALYQSRRVYVGPDYYRPLGIPTVVFSVNNYWDRYYRNRDFYRERDRWRDRPPVVRPVRPGPGYDDGPGPRPRPGYDPRPRPQPQPGFDRPDRRPGQPDFNRPDRRPDDNGGPGRQPGFDRQPDRGPAPNMGRSPDRRPDAQQKPSENKRPNFDREQNRGNIRNNPPQNRNDQRRPPACQPGDPNCANRQ